MKKEIKAKELKGKIDLGGNNKPYLIDVRTELEFSEMHIDDSELFTLNSIDKFETDKLKNYAENKELCLICRTGNRAEKVFNKLKQEGITNIKILEGGILNWKEDDLPLISNKKIISLERQVRIAAGFLVLLGIVLAILVNKNFMYLSAFVGAGLMFAGITNTCGMGILIANMPWNRSVK